MGNASHTSADTVRQAAFRAGFAEHDPEPSAEQRAELERLILAAIGEAGAEAVLPWARIRRRIPEHLRQYDSAVLTALWLDGRVWVVSVKGRWQVAAGDGADRARADRDRHHGSVTAPVAV